jgi:proteasome lid subunit RPN8/RPN11
LFPFQFDVCFKRIVTELAPASVEGETTEQHQAFVRFNERGLCYVGWYHSHPCINPIPSDKDIRMQAEMQNQVTRIFFVIFY